MEALGRIIAVCIAAVGLFLLVVFAGKTILNRQKEITVRSMAREYAGRILKERFFSQEQMENLTAQLLQLGNFEIEYTVMERVRFEADGESREFYRVSDREAGLLSEGSLIRILIAEKRSRAEVFLYGPGCFCVAGGRVS